MNNVEAFIRACFVYDSQFRVIGEAYDAILGTAEDDSRRKRYVNEVERGRFAWKRYVAARDALRAERAARSAAQLASMTSTEIKRAQALADRLGAWFAAEDAAVYTWESQAEWRQIRESGDALAAHRAQLDAALAAALDCEAYNAARSETLRSVVGRVA